MLNKKSEVERRAKLGMHDEKIQRGKEDAWNVECKEKRGNVKTGQGRAKKNGSNTDGGEIRWGVSVPGRRGGEKGEERGRIRPSMPYAVAPGAVVGG